MRILKAEIVPAVDGRREYTVLTIPSMTNPAQTYRVDIVNQRCSCPAWKFSKTRQPCKHLRALGFQGLDQPVTDAKISPEIEKLYAEAL